MQKDKASKEAMEKGKNVSFNTEVKAETIVVKKSVEVSNVWQAIANQKLENQENTESFMFEFGEEKEDEVKKKKKKSKVVKVVKTAQD